MPDTAIQDLSAPYDRPLQQDLDRCVHCGLCLNACPTYRELGLEMDSPRGRIYQMVQVAEGNLAINEEYVEHIDLCLACRACETACPSGVQYGKLVEAARGQIGANRRLPWWQRLLRWFVFDRLLTSPFLLKVTGYKLWVLQKSGLQRLVRRLGILKLFGHLAEIEALSPAVETPFFFDKVGKVFPAEGETRRRVAFLAGCIANISFARMNEATVRVLQKNGCEVTLPPDQGCCGALQVHAGLRELGRRQAKRNIEAFESGNFDAVITNAAGCGSVVKEYPELFEHDPEWHERAQAFSSKVRDVTEFLAGIDLNRSLAPIPARVTYQDSCHLLHGQKVRTPPRVMLAAIPALEFRELPLSEICCGSAGVYNVEHTDMSMALLEKKMQMAGATGADTIVTANPGCMLQLRVGAERFGSGQRVMHVVELLDESYRKAESKQAVRSEHPRERFSLARLWLPRDRSSDWPAARPRVRFSLKQLWLLLAGLETGVLAGSAVLLYWILATTLSGEGPWAILNLIGSTFFPARALSAGFSHASVSGAALHVLLSGVVGVVASLLLILYVARPVRSLWVGMLIGVIWYLAAFLWIWPLLSSAVVTYAPRPTMLVGHVLFGLGLGLYPFFVRRLGMS